MSARAEFRLRKWMVHWHFWMAIAFAFIGALLVYVVVLNARTIRDEAVRIAESDARRQAAVAQCLASRDPLHRFSEHVAGVNDFITVLVQNSAVTLASTPETSPMWRIRRANLTRLIRAREKVKELQGFPVPTKAECHQRGSE